MLLLPAAAHAADNGNFPDREETRAIQNTILQDNGVNTLTPQRINRRQASNIASSRYEGRVVGIMLDNNTNNWRVRMDREGTVFNVFVNASSGDVSAAAD